MIIGFDWEISPYQSEIDSREIEQRIATLSDEDYELSQSDRDELAALLDLRSQVVDYAEDWPYGVTLVRHDRLAPYVKDLFWDCLGRDGVDRMSQWPYTHIDWDAAAEEARADYTEMIFGEVTYYVQ